MIIRFTTTCMHPKTHEITYWFEVTLENLKYTSIDVGFSKTGEWVSASKTFYELDEAQQASILVEAAAMLPKVV